MPTRLTSYSQHFLRSPRRVLEMIGHTRLKKRHTVLDIGAGSGIISSCLATRCAQVIALEPEPQAFKKLTANTRKHANITHLQCDFFDYTLPKDEYCVFSNIPFKRSADIVRRLQFCDTPPAMTYLIVQKQFARKLTMQPHTFHAQLGAELAPWYEVRIKMPLRRTDYTPPPNVDTVLLQITPRDTPDIDISHQQSYRDTIAHCYQSVDTYHKLWRSAYGVMPERTPSQLEASEWCDLYFAIHAKASQS